MVKKLFIVVGLAIGFFNISYAATDMNSPVGRWITVSDKTHDRSGEVELTNRNGKLSGKIVKIYPGSGRDPKELCVKCEGNFKNKPVLGLTFLWGLEPQRDGTWANGKILDPHDGHVYTATLALTDNGKQIKLRGYWGIFWRTQTWIRAE